ncbi:TPA: hypothetical protein ACTADN_001889 [Salmonella enterica subsp. enterica serovar Birkenhead]
MPAWRVLREIVCRISGCKSTEFAQRHGREGIKLMGQKFFDIHESSRFNMSFKYSGEFNIIYIMRTSAPVRGFQGYDKAIYSQKRKTRLNASERVLCIAGF